MAVFESSADDVLGLWASAPPSGLVSFGIEGEAAPPEGEVYRSNLPADMPQARAIFSSSSAALTRVQTALDGIPDRLDGLVTRAQETRQAGGQGGVSFAVEPGAFEPGPEADLLEMLSDADRQALGGVSFGIGDMASEAWNSAKARLNEMVAQIDRDIRHFAWVETSIAGSLVARTTVEWNGDSQTWWDADIDQDHSRLHENTLQTATLTRNLRLRLFVTVAAGSVKVAGLMTAPGGAVLALPAVFQYVTKIVAQARQLNSIQIPQGV